MKLNFEKIPIHWCWLCAALGVADIVLMIFLGFPKLSTIPAFFAAFMCFLIIRITNEKVTIENDEEQQDLVDRLASKPVDLNGQDLYDFMVKKDRCPDCRASPLRLLEGPSGGVSTNVMCAVCKAKFNICPLIGFAERI